MQHLELYLNDQLCDLSDDSPMALSFQINNLADVKNQAGNTSNQFKLPLTQNNRRILGFPDDIRVTTNVPYTQLKAVVIQNGIEVIPAGLCEVLDADDNNADVTIISGNVDFFDQIDGSIYQMGDKTTIYGAKQPFLPYQHIWNLQNVVNSRSNTSGYIYPVIDYGNLNPLIPYSINVRDLRPAFFLKTAIDLIIAQTGYKATGSMLSDPLYNKIIIPFANDNFEHGTDYQTQPDELGMLAYTSSDQSTTHVSQFDTVGKGIFKFLNENSDPKNQFDGQTFTATEIFTGEVLVTIPKFYFTGKFNADRPSNVNVTIYLETPDGVLQTPFNYDLINGTRVEGTSGGGLRRYETFGIQKISTTIDFQPGYKVTVRWEFFNDNPQTFIMYAGASLSIKAQNTNVLFGQAVQCERIFPDISQKDLLKDTLQRFGIICQTDNTNQTVSFASFRDIVKNIPVAKDWTAKCVNVGKNNSFKLGDYGQQNNMLYKQDDAIPDGYADDVIKVDNKNLPASVDLFTSQFAPSLNTAYAGGYVAQIRKIEEDATSDEFTVGTQPRVLVDYKLNLFTTGSNASITFTDGTNNRIINDVISAPYFYKLNGEFSLMWKDMDSQKGLRTIYYKELERILKQTKLVTRFFILTPLDIAELDLLVPIYLEQDNAYFYINKINNWIKGQAIKVDLVKIGEI